MSNQKELSIEQALDEIENRLETLQRPDITLEESFKVYKEGIDLVASCSSKIDKIEKQVKKINEAGETDEF